MKIINSMVGMVNQDRLKANLFYLAKDPLPYRKLNYTVQGHGKNTLYEADDYIQSMLESWGYQIEREECRVQAFRQSSNKSFEKPLPEDPWDVAYNLYARKVGVKHPDEIILLVSHKDSQSWIDSPGAYDNTVGTVANLEIARILSDYDSKRSIWFLFCNEEHTPWTSVTAAQNAKARGDKIIAVLNLDGLGGKSQADIDAGLKTNVTLYTTPEGERIADLMCELNERYKLGLVQRKVKRKSPGDDDGSFIKAGYPAAVANIGSFPYTDANYHKEGDTPENVDLENVWMSTRLSLAACLWMDTQGYPKPPGGL